MHKEEKKRGNRLIIFFIISLLIIALAGIGGIYYILFEYKDDNSTENVGKVLVNPSKGLSLDDAVKDFNEDYIYFLLFSIKAYNLYEAPFSDELPTIQIDVEDGSYYGEVNEGRIRVGEGTIENEDIVIYSSKEEIIKIMQDRDYVKDSFKNGLSKIELKTDKLELYSKGYLDIYDELTGE
ncbi:MAG: hypothetical protein Q7S27_03565 [Nanoarchaeota archaeon]|nr:hypothetical protein [Nanoarchaeota archaeon]